MGSMQERLEKALDDLSVFKCVLDKVDSSKMIIPLMQKREAIGCLCVDDRNKKYPVSFYNLRPELKLSGYARVTNNMCKGYDSEKAQCEFYIPVHDGTINKICWVFPFSKEKWVRIKGLRINGRLYQLGDNICNPYLKHLDICAVDLKNAENKDMCRVYLMKGNLAQCTLLEGYEHAAERIEARPYSQNFKSNFTKELQEKTNLIPGAVSKSNKKEKGMDDEEYDESFKQIVREMTKSLKIKKDKTEEDLKKLKALQSIKSYFCRE